MLERRISVTQGPPGTGKSKTAAHGIANLHLADDGLIVACCPSNYACDVLYEKLKEINLCFNVGMQIIRMQSYSREKKLLNETGLEDADQNQLHVMVRKHPNWGSCPKIKKIMEKAAHLGGALLKQNEQSLLELHNKIITNEIIRNVDVVICTVSCANDGRLNMALSSGFGKGHKLAGLIIDEASVLTVPSCLPLLNLNPPRIWLIGDHCQLRPNVQSESARAACLDVSWMEFLLTAYVD